MGRLREQSVLALAYGWADAFGAWFGQVFRSAFVTNFLLAAFAVLAAALSLVWSDPGKLDATALADLAHHKVPFVVFELICILTVMVNTASGRWHGWHRRWFEAREVAERLRVALPLWVLGVRPATFAGEEPTWTGWYARAIVRAQGMRAGTLDVSALNASRATLNAVLRHQCDYHKSSASRMGNMERRLEWVGLILFVLTLITVGLFLTALYAGVSVTPWVAYLVTALAARTSSACHRNLWHPRHRRFRGERPALGAHPSGTRKNHRSHRQGPARPCLVTGQGTLCRRYHAWRCFQLAPCG